MMTRLDPNMLPMQAFRRQTAPEHRDYVAAYLTTNELRLLAAAPDMLAALERIRDNTGTLEELAACPSDMSLDEYIARTAIAKATGAAS